MQVILTDDVLNLGKRGDVVKVAGGYGRNYLLPRGLAVPATPGNLKMVQQQQLALARKDAKHKEEAQVLARELETLHVLISRKSGESGALFGSVTGKDLADLLESNGIHLDRRKILLDHPIKSIGNFTVEIRLHSEVGVGFLVSVLAEGDEPVLQVKKRDAESEQIVSQLEAKVQEAAAAVGSSSAAPAESGEEAGEPSETEPARKKAGRKTAE